MVSVLKKNNVPKWFQCKIKDYNTYWKKEIRKTGTAATTATRSTMGLTLPGTDAWKGGVLGEDGKIYGIPRRSLTVLQINTLAGYSKMGKGPYLNKF